jgi:hypothetical protein
MITKMDIELINQDLDKSLPMISELKVYIKGHSFTVEQIHKSFMWALSKVCEEVK